MQSWIEVLDDNETNKAYPGKLLEMYDNCTKITSTYENIRYTISWFMKTLVNVCKKIMNNKTKIASSVRCIKNNLVTIFFNCRRNYYNKLLQKNKNDNKISLTKN